MANINDYKLVAIKSSKYFNFLAQELEINNDDYNQKTKERFGFYLYMLENVTGNQEVLDLVDLITDTDFNKTVFDDNFEDYGIDAVDIDEEDNIIRLFNFKYREKFKPNQAQSENETILSTKFINALINENTSNIKGKLKDCANRIIDNLVNSNDIWKLQLFVISNEPKELSPSNVQLQQLEEIYGMEVVPIGLNQISKLMSIRPDPINCELVVDKDAIMSFSESSISSSKSYVLRLSLSELVRITCADKTLRHKYNIEDLSPIAYKEIDFGALFDNVRGLVLNSNYNSNIHKTLKEEPTKFFLYNNGVTITANDVEAETINAAKKVKLSIKNFQVLNGGQTLRTIHAYNQEDPSYINTNLSSSEILVRVFKTPVASTLTNKIAEYTNSQNSISPIDLKSLSSEQIQLEQYLDENNIIYSRKTGDTGLRDKPYDHKISMERFGQILFTLQGNPHKATNQKKHIFGKFYDQIFGPVNLDISKSPDQIKQYFNIKKAYDNHPQNYKVSDQKIFFIMYVLSKRQFEIGTLISEFENELQSFVPAPGRELSESRKLLSLKFKEHLDEKFNLNAHNNG